MNYTYFLESKLSLIKANLGIENNIYVADEQSFVKIKLEPKNIYVVVKYLASTLAYDGKVQPIQLMVLSEQNSLETAKALFNQFTSENNLVAEIFGSDLVKQTYSTPVVVNNYTEIGYGFNSLLYISGTLFILSDIVDLTDLTVDGVDVKISSFNDVYAMTGNTQPVSGNFISSTVKSVSTVNCSFVLPMIAKYNALILKVLKIKAGLLSGDTGFVFNYNIASGLSGEVSGYDVNGTYSSGDVCSNGGFIYRCTSSQAVTGVFDPTKWEEIGVVMSYTMKLVSANFTTAPNSAPSLNLGFMV